MIVTPPSFYHTSLIPCTPITNRAQFDGSASYLSIPVDAAMDFSTDFTIFGWDNLDSTQSTVNGIAIKKADYGAIGNGGFVMQRHTGGFVTFRVCDSVGTIQEIFHSGVANDTNHFWHVYFDAAATKIGAAADGAGFTTKTNANLSSSNENASEDLEMGGAQRFFKGFQGAVYVCQGTAFTDHTKLWDYHESTDPLKLCELHEDVQAAVTYGWERQDDLITDVKGVLPDADNINGVELVAL